MPVAVGVVAREVEQVDAGEDDKEAAEKRDCVYGGGGVEALEEQEGGCEGAGREGYVVEGVDTIDNQHFVTIQMLRRGRLDVHVGGELAQRLVEVVHLRENASDNHNDKHICRGVRKLIIPRKRHLERQPKRLDEHDRDGPSGRADGEVNERVLAPVLGRDLVDHKGGEDGDEEAVEQEACITEARQHTYTTSTSIIVSETYLAESQDAKSHPRSQPPCPAAHAAQ